MRRVRRLAVALGVLCALAVALDWAVEQVSLEKRRALLERELSAALGREVHLGGELRLSLLPRPVLEATQVEVAGAPGASAPPLLEIEHLNLALALRPLLERRLQLDRLEARGVDLRLGTEGGGGTDILAGLERLAGGGGEPERAAIGIRIGRVELRDARVDWLDAASGRHTTLRIDALRLVTDARDEPVEWSVRGGLRGESFAFEGRGGSLAALLEPGEPWPLSLDGQVGEATIRLRGHIARPAQLEGLDLDLEVSVPDVGSLLAAESAKPGLGAARLRGHLTNPGGEPALDRIVVETGPAAELHLRIEGAVRRLADPSGIELDVEIEADKLRFLELLSGRPLPQGTARAKFQVSDRDGTLGVEGEAHAESGDGAFRVDVRGRFGDLRGGDALDARLRIAAPALDALGDVAGLDWELPALGPVVASGRLRTRGGVIGAEGLELDAGAHGGTWLSVRGSLRDLRALRGVALQVSAGARNAAALGSLFDVELPAVGPLVFDGRVAGSEQRIDTHGTATLGQSRIAGHGSAELGGGRPRIAAELSSAHLRLEDIGLGSAAAGPAAGAPAWGGVDVFRFEDLRRLDARLDLRADRVTAGDSVDVRNARARIDLEDGDLRVSDVDLEYQGGRIAGELRIDARTPDPRLALRAEARALDLARLGVALGRPGATGSGVLDLSVDLRSGGATQEALRRRLAGRAAFAARDWSSASELARRFLFDLAQSFLPQLRRGPERLGCFRGDLRLDAGVARVDSLELASERATVLGTGTVDLVGERWHLELVPEVREGRLLEVATAVRVSGPLDAPKFKPIPLGLVAGTLRGLVRGALLPANKVTAGAQRALGSAGKLLAPLRAGIGLASGTAPALEPGACVLPQPPGADSRSPSGSPG